MGRPLRALLVEDLELDADLVARELRRGGFDVTFERVDTRAAMAAALAHATWDVVIADYALPSFSAPEALTLLQERRLDLPFLIVSGTVNEEIAVSSMRAGAHDFISKDRLTRLVPAVERELREAALRAERGRLAEAMHEAQATLQAVLDCVPAVIIAVDRDGRIRFVNRVSASATVEEAVGRSWLVEIPPEHHPLAREHLRLVLDDGLPRTSEVMVSAPDGSKAWYASNVSPLRRGGAIVGAVVLAQDVTALKRAQEQLLVSDRMVSVGTLAAGIAHEINNPLAALIANVGFAREDMTAVRRELEEGGRSAPRGKAGLLKRLEAIEESLREISLCAERVRQIVRDVKVFSRPDEETTGAVDLRNVLESSLRMVWNEVRHRARIVKDYASTSLVEGNEARLGQIFLNLLVNAAQAIPEGRADENTITIRTHDEAGHVVVEIGDTGGGIPEAIRARVFDPFFTTKPVGVGTGLGLAICLRLVSEYGGRIDLDSEVGRGTTFRLTFPAAHAEVEPARRAAPPPAPGRRGRVLIVDDEPSIGAAIERILGGDHEVVVLQRASDALERVEGGERFDVILCDLMMPHMSGMEFHAELSLRAPELARRMVAITGGAFTAAARRFLDEIGLARIEKPFDPGHVRAVVNQLVA